METGSRAGVTLEEKCKIEYYDVEENTELFDIKERAS